MEQVVPHGPISEPLHEHSHQSVFRYRISIYINREESYMLSVSVYTTLTLLELLKL